MNCICLAFFETSGESIASVSPDLSFFSQGENVCKYISTMQSALSQLCERFARKNMAPSAQPTNQTMVTLPAWVPQWIPDYVYD